MENTSRGNRLHIGFYGKTNAGKSTLINNITGQNVSIVSEQKGTTTDVVYKPMELLPIGSVVFMDTAGLDDITKLGEKRIQNTLKTVDKADITVIVCDYTGWGEEEVSIVKKAQELGTDSIISIITKNDIVKISDKKLSEIKKYTKNIIITFKDDENITSKFKELLIKITPKEFIENKTITGNLINEKDIVILVTPIDKEAPKGRLILPQVQVLREILDKNAQAIVVKETELNDAISSLKEPPKLVITDSQVFNQVSKTVSQTVPLTSFSILFANFKGDIKIFSDGAKAVDNLKENDEILFLESCTHHATDDDIARVKIPKLIEKKTGKHFKYTYHSGCSLPDDIERYSLAIHCGACMTNGKEVLSRIYTFQKSNIPVTNYGIVIAYCLGILDRAIEPLLQNNKI